MPVVTATPDTCPSTCALKNGGGCYAELGPLGLFWRKLATGSVKGIDFQTLLKAIRALPRKQMWRYGQAGDLPDAPEDVLALAAANRGRAVLVYTHKRDVETYRQASALGFNINLSADSPEEADELAKTGLPVVTVLPSSYTKEKDETLRDYRDRMGGTLSLRTEGGNKIAICPATYLKTSCLECGACSKPRSGDTIIGFPAHGSSRKRIDRRLTPSEVPTACLPTRPRPQPSVSLSLT